MKNSKKKVLIAAVLAGVLLLGAIVSIVLVLAAQQQNISSNIRITYSVDGVGAKVSAKYGSIKPTGEVNLANMTTPDGVSTELNFSVSDTNGGASLTPNGDIELTQETGTEVVFEYRFENTADTLFTIGMKSTGTAVNIAEYYYVSTEPLAAAKYGKIAEPLLNGTNAGELVIPKQAILSTTNPGNVVYIYVKVAVANINKSASYEKNYDWELKQLTTEQVPFDLALNNGDGSGENSVKAIKGAVVPVMATLPTAPAGKGFAGYYDAQTEGNLIVSKNGIGVKEINTETTLYARYDEASVMDVVGTTMYGISPTASGVTEVEVPATVTEIADGAFENNTSLESVTIGGETAQATGYATGSALKKIGSKAFAGCTNLTEIIFADRINLKTIGSEAFKGCIGLTELNLPASVNEAETDFVAGCTGLTKLSLNADLIPVGTSSNCGLKILLGDIYSQIIEVELSGKTINNYAFYNCTNVNTITIQESVTSLGNYAFYKCSSLKSITFEKNSKVTIIGDSAFRYCTNLTSISLGNSLLTIGSRSFDNCTSLTEIKIPNTVTTIEMYAFNMCTELTSVAIGNSLTTIGNGVFTGCKNLVQVRNLSGLELNGYTAPSYAEIKTDNSAFSSNVEIGEKYAIFTNGSEKVLLYATDKTITSANDLPSDLTQINLDVFSDCTSLTTVTIPNSVITIGDRAFKGCASLSSVVVGNSVTTIGKNAFYECSNLIEISLPNSVTAIGDNAFDSCKSLTTVIIESSVTTIGNRAFYRCYSIVQVRNLSGQTLRGYTAPSYAEVRTDNLPFESSVEIGEKYAIFTNGSEKALVYATDKKITTATDLPSDLTQIGQNAFANFANLTEITIPNSVTAIGEDAFNGCSGFMKVNITNLVAWLNISFSNMFSNPLYYANNLYINDVLLTELEIPLSVTEIKPYAFSNCTSLTSVTMGNSVTIIGSYAFSSCTSLTSVTMGNSVTTIGGSAFSSCTNLSTVTFENTTGWKIYKNSSATTGYDIDVTNATTNATNLKNTSSSPSSPSTSATNWGKWYLKRSA